MKSQNKYEIVVKGIVPVAVVIALVSVLIGLFFGVDSGVQKDFSGMDNVREVSIRDSMNDAPNSWAWFLIGGMSALVLFILWNWRNL